MNEKKQIEDIVAMLDNFMENGGGHMNIAVHEGEIQNLQINTFKSSDCSTGNMACSVPTLIECVDQE